MAVARDGQLFVLVVGERGWLVPFLYDAVEQQSYAAGRIMDTHL